jgi:hypothetical protein
MKVVGFVALHYGREYLGWSIRSIIDHIDELHIAYTAIGSHGHRTQVRCPETRDELYTIAQAAAGDKLRWNDGEWPHEGAQRDSIHEYAPDADAILVLDADEVWSEGLAECVLSAAYQGVAPKITRVGIVHYWRSFYCSVLHDPANPVRMIYPKAHGGEGTLDQRHKNLVINHMGYAQSPEIVEYKILTHGHKGEWRKDVDWFKDRYLANAQNDCHPVGSEYWNPERVDPADYMPRFMTEHPYYFKGLIE